MRNLLVVGISMLGMVAASCIKDKPTNGRTYTAPPPVIPVMPPVNDTALPRSYLALGDSYTIGQSISVADRFPVQTVKFLAEQGLKFEAPEIIAQTGWTTGNLISTLDNTALAGGSYDIVTLLIGVNNQYQGRSKQEYTDQFLVLLQRAVAYAGKNKKRVIVLSLPDYSVTPFASGSNKAFIAAEIDSFNVINRTIAANVGVNYLDITPASRLAANDRTLVATDGLHPSGLQYKLWVEGLVPIIKKALK